MKLRSTKSPNPGEEKRLVFACRVLGTIRTPSADDRTDGLRRAGCCAPVATRTARPSRGNALPSITLQVRLGRKCDRGPFVNVIVNRLSNYSNSSWLL